MQVKLYRWLKVASVLACFLIFYPLPAFFCLFAFQNQNWGSTAALGVCLLVGTISYVVSLLVQKLIQKKQIPVSIQKLLLIVWVLIVVGIGTIILSGISQVNWRALSLGVTAIAFYAVLGCWVFYKDYRELSQERNLAVAAVVYGLSILLMWQYCRHIGGNYQVEVYIFLFLIILFLHGILKNQCNLDYMLERRHHKLEHLPQKVRCYNMLLVTVLFLLVLFGFLFRKQILDLLQILWEGVKVMILAILTLMQWLGSLFTVSQDGVSESGEMPMVPQAEETGTQFFSSDFYLLLMLIVLAALLIWKRHELWAAIQILLDKLRDLLYHWFHSTVSVRKFGETNQYYYDQEEKLSGEERGRIDSAQKTDSWKNWKKSYKKYMRLSDNEQKFRYGYRLMLRWLRLHGSDWKTSDTPLEILQNEKKSFRNTNCKIITDSYNLFRYREDSLNSADYHQMDELLQTLSSQEK